jgi:hypothetical protein
MMTCLLALEPGTRRTSGGVGLRFVGTRTEPHSIFTTVVAISMPWASSGAHIDLKQADKTQVTLMQMDERLQELKSLVSNQFRNVPLLTALEMSPF